MQGVQKRRTKSIKSFLFQVDSFLIDEASQEASLTGSEAEPEFLLSSVRWGLFCCTSKQCYICYVSYQLESLLLLLFCCTSEQCYICYVSYHCESLLLLLSPGVRLIPPHQRQRWPPLLVTRHRWTRRLRPGLRLCWRPLVSPGIVPVNYNI